MIPILHLEKKEPQMIKSSNYRSIGSNLELPIGFNGEDSQIISSSDTNNVHGKLAMAKDTSLVYKLIIPVKCITSVAPFKDEDLLSIGFESGFLERQNPTVQTKVSE